MADPTSPALPGPAAPTSPVAPAPMARNLRYVTVGSPAPRRVILGGLIGFLILCVWIVGNDGTSARLHGAYSTPSSWDPTPPPSDSSPGPDTERPTVPGGPSPTQATAPPSPVVGVGVGAPFADNALLTAQERFTPTAPWANRTDGGPGVTTDAAVAKAERPLLSQRLRCMAPAAKDTDRAPPPSVYRYDVALLPVGCHGDGVKSAATCRSSSCRLIAELRHAAKCGHTTVGAFLGDNYYLSGLKSRKDPRLERDNTAKVWRWPQLQVPWYVTMGNHDKRAFNQLRSDHRYWVAPAFQHASPLLYRGGSVPGVPAISTEAPPDPGPDAPPIARVTDSPPPPPRARPDVAGATVQLFLVASHWGFGANAPHMAQQAAWLDAALGNSTADWKIVATHEPLWAFMAFAHATALVKHLHPVLVKHRVQLFIAAHMHSVAFHRCPGGYYQLVSAGFADNIHTVVAPDRPKGFFHLGRGATAVLANATHLVVAGLGFGGRELFTFAIDRAAQRREMDAVARGDAAATAALEAETGPAALWDRDRHPCDAFKPALLPRAGCEARDRQKAAGRSP